MKWFIYDLLFAVLIAIFSLVAIAAFVFAVNDIFFESTGE